ncbi:Golgi integral membrane protein 4-like [Anneissia japonica]|uniref:Golgi integral membrane protein 4-like n=1 Tax=Anneissia japonica TaxID=1529436 RepID=UPI001425B2CA|nr:Golgi integral membrane protein 4-like [Anneissia japonica]
MEEEHKEEMPVAVEEPHVTTEETPTSQQEALTELENVKDTPTAEVEMASDEKSVQDSETGGEKVADVNTDAVEDGDNKESEDQEVESNEVKIEDAPAQVAENGEVKDGGNGEENDGTTERKDTEGGDQTSPGEEENEEDQVTKAGSQPDPQQQTAEEEEPKSPLPESSTFGEGERPETPVVAVTDPLSREGSPVQEPPQAIPPGTPERIRSPVIEEDRYEEEEVEEEDQLEPREKIVERYQVRFLTPVF